MSQIKAIVAGAAIIAASILFVGDRHSATASVGGPYQLMQHSNNTANAGVFRLDTSSGDVSYCYVLSSGQADVVCTKSVR